MLRTNWTWKELSETPSQKVEEVLLLLNAESDAFNLKLQETK